ncbi:MAG: GNAT family N-acetyltransferase [Candidatus Rokubacteria bacterium]|nr:GNAT family N-acetyltransferase [Candidatus Rokubacteria bacterium]
MKVEVRDHLDAIGADAWTRLHAASRLRSPFLSWVWQAEWVRAFAAGRRLEIWTVEGADDRLVAALPLCEIAPGRFQIVGGADVSDYLDLLADDGREEEAWLALLQARSARRARWELHAVPEGSVTVSALPALAAGAGLTATVALEEKCPVLDLPPSWQAYLASLPGKHRHELQRKTRRLERELPGARPVCVRTPAEAAGRLDDFLALHRRSRVGKARFMDERMDAFFRRVTAGLAEAGALGLWLLDTPGGPIASFIILEWEGTVGLYNSGFHPDRAALAPGLVLLGHLVRDAIERGMRRFDFLRGEERYKYEFGPHPENVYRVEIA